MKKNIDELLKACRWLVSEYVPEYKKKNFPISLSPIKNELVKWIKQLNIKRTFIFLSKTTLESMISEKRIVPQSNKKGVDKMIGVFIFYNYGGSDEDRFMNNMMMAIKR